MPTIRECEEKVIEAAEAWVDVPHNDPKEAGTEIDLIEAVEALDAARAEQKKGEASIPVPPPHVKEYVLDREWYPKAEWEARVREIAEQFFDSAWMRFDGRTKEMRDEIVRLEKRIDALEVTLEGGANPHMLVEHERAIARLAREVSAAESFRIKLAEMHGNLERDVRALEQKQSDDSSRIDALANVDADYRLRKLESKQTPTTIADLPRRKLPIVCGMCGAPWEADHACTPTTAPRAAGTGLEPSSEIQGKNNVAGNQSGSSAPPPPASAETTAETENEAASIARTEEAEHRAERRVERAIEKGRLAGRAAGAPYWSRLDARTFEALVEEMDDAEQEGYDEGQDDARRRWPEAIRSAASAARERAIEEVLALELMKEPHECAACDLSDEERSHIAAIATRLNHIRQTIRALLAPKKEG